MIKISDIEKLVLSLMMTTNDELVYKGVVNNLIPQQFSVEENRVIYNGLDNMIRSDIPLEIPAIAQEIGNDQLEQIGGMGYLRTVAGFKNVVSQQGLEIKNWKYYTKIVDTSGKLHVLRNSVGGWSKKLDDIESLIGGEDDAETLYAKMLTELSDLKLGTDSGYVHVSEAADNVLKKLGKILEGELDVIPINFPSLYNLGLPYSPSFGVIAGIPSSGKSQICFMASLGAAIHIKNEGSTDVVTIDSLETTDENIVTRIACTIAAVDSKKLRLNLLNQEEVDRFVKAVEFIAELPLLITDNQDNSSDKVFSRMLATSLSRHIRLATLDYIELFGDKKEKSEELRISNVTRTVKRAIYKVETCGLAISQLNANYKKTGSKLGSIEDTRYTQVLFHAADWGGVIYNPISLDSRGIEFTPPEGISETDVTFVLNKYKEGDTPNIAFGWIPENTRLIDKELPFGFDYSSAYINPLARGFSLSPTPSIVSENGSGERLDSTVVDYDDDEDSDY